MKENNDNIPWGLEDILVPEALMATPSAGVAAEDPEPAAEPCLGDDREAEAQSAPQDNGGPYPWEERGQDNHLLSTGCWGQTSKANRLWAHCLSLGLGDTDPIGRLRSVIRLYQFEQKPWGALDQVSVAWNNGAWAAAARVSLEQVEAVVGDHRSQASALAYAVTHIRVLSGGLEDPMAELHLLLGIALGEESVGRIGGLDMAMRIAVLAGWVAFSEDHLLTARVLTTLGKFWPHKVFYSQVQREVLGLQRAERAEVSTRAVGARYGTTVGGGHYNVSTANDATVGGGRENTSSGLYATVSGGDENTSSGYAGTVGGAGNIAEGRFGFAAGHNAQALHDGAFVWSDDSAADIASTNGNSWTVRASGGVRFFASSDATVGVQLPAGGNAWSPMSDRNVKENFAGVDSREVLEKVSRLPVTEWNLISQPDSIRHIGPMAQDFHAAFGVGEDDKHISTSDADGVALAAIQGLNQVVKEKDARIEKLEKDVSELKAMVETLLTKSSGGGQ